MLQNSFNNEQIEGRNFPLNIRIETKYVFSTRLSPNNFCEGEGRGDLNF